VPGQHRSGQIVEAPSACFAPIALAMGLRVVVAVPDDDTAVTHGAARTFRPAVLAHQREALGVIQQARKVDQIGCSHDKSSSREPVSYSRFCSRTRCSQPNCPVLASPPRNPIRASSVYLLNCMVSRGQVYGVGRFSTFFEDVLVKPIRASSTERPARSPHQTPAPRAPASPAGSPPRDPALSGTAPGRPGSAPAPSSRAE